MRLVQYRGKWYAYIARGKRVSLRATDRIDAERKLEDLKIRVSKKVVSVGKIVDSYIEENKKKPSHRTMVSSWKVAKSHFENMNPEHISRDTCRKFIAKRQKDGIANETIRKEIGVVRAAVRWHSKMCPATFELPPASPPRERYLTKNEFKTLLGAMRHHHLKIFTMLALSTAGRRTAVLELTWDRVDFDRRIIKLGKGDKTLKGRAVVPMTDSLYKALMEAKEGATCEYVVEYGGNKIITVGKGFRTAADSVGMKDVTPHTLRHTAAVWMAESGVSMDEIAQFLGHTNPSITYRVYARFSPEYLQKAAKALDI